MDKRALRKQYKAIRAAVADKAAKSAAITARLLSLAEYRAAAHIALFVSFGDEVDTSAILFDALRCKTVALPRIYGAQMRFHAVQRMEQLQTGTLGIREPAPELPLREDFAVAILPGLAFDRRGGRIGYGGGYYDRYFAHRNALRIGVCFEEQLLESVPQEAHDLRVHLVVTDRRVLDLRPHEPQQGG